MTSNSIASGKHQQHDTVPSARFVSKLTVSVIVLVACVISSTITWLIIKTDSVPTKADTSTNVGSVRPSLSTAIDEVQGKEFDGMGFTFTVPSQYEVQVISGKTVYIRPPEAESRITLSSDRTTFVNLDALIDCPQTEVEMADAANYPCRDIWNKLPPVRTLDSIDGRKYRKEFIYPEAIADTQQLVIQTTQPPYIEARTQPAPTLSTELFEILGSLRFQD